MKKKFLIIIFCCAVKYDVCVAQAGEWTWMKGDSTSVPFGVFGTQGAYSSLNNPPGLYEPSEWKDLAGHFWLFGGVGEYNTLWEYDPSINQWRWMGGSNYAAAPGVYGTQGIPSSNNIPGARGWGAASWTDNSGNFFLFGGGGYDVNGYYGSLNDLWQYDVSTGEWTWMSGSSMIEQTGVYGIQTVPGPANHPGARSETNSSWIDASGNIWLFGGYALYPFGSFNDLWRFDLSTLEWTWMKGASYPNPGGIYGTLGVADINNTPGGRMSYSKWKDQSGNFWLFSGLEISTYDLRNDVWKYDPQANEWTWMSGSNSVNSQGSLSSNCDPLTTNIPSARFENRAAWSDCGGHLWTFGGAGDAYGYNSFSDLWSFNSNTLEWTLVNGTTLGNQPGFYGAQGIPSPDNYPQSRFGAISWIDDSCNLWMFGGSGLNDLWKFQPDPSCPGTFVCNSDCNPLSQISFGASSLKLCEKFCIDFFDSSSNNPTAWQWIFPGGSPSSSTDQNPNNICYTVPGIFDVTLITTNANGNDTLTLYNYITVYPTPPFPTITQVGYTLTSSPASSYQWQFNSIDIPGATNQWYTILQTGYYTVVVGDEHGCVNSFTVYVLISGIDDVMSDGNISIYPNPSSGNFMVEWLNGLMADQVSIDVVNTLGQIIFSSTESRSIGTTSGFQKEIDLSNAASGIYFIEIKTASVFVRKKILIAE
ncbi:MAG TPA: kelch repeat-containing protein [Chitinophagales bacterium]|nr:kelch repeat-containing protein [Chitinophagales bacterium]